MKIVRAGIAKPSQYATGHNRVAARLRAQSVRTIIKIIDRDRLTDRIDDPIFAHAAAGVDGFLRVPVVQAGTGREHFDTEVGRTLDDVTDNADVFVADKEQIGLDNRLRFENDIHRCTNDDAEIVCVGKCA